MSDEEEIFVFVEEADNFVIVDEDFSDIGLPVFDGNIIEVEVPGVQGPASTVPGPKGDPGEKGERGESAEGSLRTEIQFNIPANPWIITHNFPYRPVVTIFDHNSEEVFADIIFVSSTTIRIEFAYEMTGMVQLA